MQKYLLKADPDLFARIDAAADKGGRAEWIREACEMRLAGLLPVRDVRDEPVDVSATKSKTVAKATTAETRHFGVVTRPPRKRDWSGEFPAVLDVLPDHAYSVPALAKRLGWTDLKTDKVLRDMEHRGLVRFDRGMVTALEPV